VAFYAIKQRKIWIIKAMDRRTGRTMAWVLDGRDAATFPWLYDTLKHFTACVFYTDDGDALAQVLPKACHSTGNVYTQALERDHSPTRPHLARMTRRTKVGSQAADRLHASLKLWWALNVQVIFEADQAIFLSIFN
jgi:IS1 family transposase